MTMRPTSALTIRAAIEQDRGRMSFIFDIRQRREIMKQSLLRGGRYWLAVWLMRRFSNYAMTALGVRNSQRWNNRKRRDSGQAIPFIGLTPPGGGPAAPRYSQVNGAKMIDAVSNAKITAIGIIGRESLTIRVPYGHPIRGEKSVAFKRLPQHEVDGIAKEVAAEIERFISGGKPAPASGKAARPRSVTMARPRSVA